MLKNLRKIYHPSWFQGSLKSKNYFEGWYFKIVSLDGKNTWAFIPGISLGNEENHAFIQVINGITGRSWYFKFPLEDFKFSHNRFEVEVAGNRFSDQGFELDLSDSDSSFKGVISFQNPTHFPVSLLRPGIMGWYRYVPFMECYHGVVSLHHTLHGNLELNGNTLDFSNGKGYVEKDWGTSMPKAWIWMQSNHFEEDGTSFMMSIARIPWLGSSFTGFLGFFLHKGMLYPFATYTGASINLIQAAGDSVQVRIKAGRFCMTVEGRNKTTGELKAPVDGEMHRIIHESVDAELFIGLRDKNGSIIFEGRGGNAGLERVGDMKLLGA